MAEEATTPAAPAGETEQTPTTNINTTEQAQQPVAEAPKAPDLHGFTEEQLADMAKFYAANGGYDKVKSRLSNPPQQQQEQPQQQIQQPQQQAQESQQPQQQVPNTPPKGFVSPQELFVKNYFSNLAKDPKYTNIAKEIESGEIFKEMQSFGMTPIDKDSNINVDQVNRFLELKAASIPTKPTSDEITNTPTVDYVQVDGEVKDMNQAIAIIQQSMDAKGKGIAEHPNLAEAKKFLSDHWGKKIV